MPNDYKSRENNKQHINTPTHVVHQPRVYEFARYLVERSGCPHVIDVGCGSGGKVRALEGKVQITCLDAEIMRQSVDQMVPSARFIGCDLEEGLPDLSGIAESALVICSDVIEHLKRPEVLVRALAQLSRVAAYVLISTQDRSRAHGLMYDGLPGNPAHAVGWTADELGRFIKDCGFSPLTIVGYTVNNDHDLAKNTILVIGGVEAEFRRPERTLSVAAIVSTFNEADIIESVLRHLQSEGVETHVFDNWSCDSTFEIVNRLMQEGVCKSVKRYPEEPSPQYEWSRMLEHHAAYGSRLEADWILHNDADEIRVAPWPLVKLREAISFVDLLGYSAIDFTVINFAFTDESSEFIFDPESLKFFDFGRQAPDLQQIKGWKNRQAVDLASTGGHSCLFENRKIYPLKFLNKHYPLRSVEQANRKVFVDRLPRVVKENRERGWHTHYDIYSEVARIKPWRKFELLNFDLNVFNADYLVERLSGIGIETETRPIPNIETRFAQAELDAAKIALQRQRIRELQESRPEDDVTVEQIYSRPGTAITKDYGIDEVRRLEAALRAVIGKLQATQSELQAIGKQLAISTAHIRRLNEHIRQSNRRSISRFVAKLKRVIGGIKRLTPDAATILRSPFFDANWYLAQYPDVAGSDIELASHYADFGWRESRQPSALFDGPWYLDQNPDVAEAGVNPLVHYMNAGWFEGRTIRDLASGWMSDALASSVRPCRAKAPPWEEFEELAAAHKGAALTLAPCVDVIVPVYRGYNETFACLGSILRSKNRTPFELIVVDDCSPEPEISHALCKLAKLGLITLVKNKSNVGFVGTVNHGMALHPDRDVLLLNSDTLVFNDWLDKLKVHASGDVATVTPFTNNGTISSYPVYFHDNNRELELSFEELDRLAAAVNKCSCVEVPTSAGSCMYIVRHALSDVGFFDQASFVKGDGAEVDFCMRARGRGWRNMHALDTFVFHSGETSFSGDASERKEDALARLCKLHPDYPKVVQTYIERDAARLARASLDLARFHGRFPNATVLYFTHTWGRASERYLRNRTEFLRKKGRDMILALPSAPGPNSVRLTHIDAKSQFRNLAQIDLKRDKKILKELLSRLKTQSIEVQGNAGSPWPMPFLNAVGELAAGCGLELSFVADD